MITCRKCGSVMASTSTGAYYCPKCGTWNEFKTEPAKSETPKPQEGTLGTIEVALNEKTYEPFMKEFQDENSILRTQLAKATNEVEVRTIVQKTIERLSGERTTTVTNNPPAEEVKDGLLPANLAYTQTKKQNENNLYLAKKKAEEERQNTKAVQTVIAKLIASVNAAIKEGQFKTTVSVEFTELNGKTENYNAVKAYFVDRGYRVTATLNDRGKTLSIFVGWLLN